MKLFYRSDTAYAKEKFQRTNPKMSFEEILSKITCPSTPAREKNERSNFSKNAKNCKRAVRDALAQLKA